MVSYCIQLFFHTYKKLHNYNEIVTIQRENIKKIVHLKGNYYIQFQKLLTHSANAMCCYMHIDTSKVSWLFFFTKLQTFTLKIIVCCVISKFECLQE